MGYVRTQLAVEGSSFCSASRLLINSFWCHTLPWAYDGSEPSGSRRLGPPSVGSWTAIARPPSASFLSTPSLCSFPSSRPQASAWALGLWPLRGWNLLPSLAVPRNPSAALPTRSGSSCRATLLSDAPSTCCQDRASLSSLSPLLPAARTATHPGGTEPAPRAPTPSLQCWHCLHLPFKFLSWLWEHCAVLVLLPP